MRAALFALIAESAALALLGDTPAAMQPPIVLPPVTVTDSKLLPPPESWRYGRMEGFEILSSASDSDTKRIIRDLARFQQAIGIAWPSMAADQRMPGTILLCGQAAQFAALKPETDDNAIVGSISICLRDHEQAAIVLDLSSSVLALLPSDPNGDATQATTAPGSPAGAFAVDHDRQLHREYMHFLFGRMSPRPAPWLEEGLSQLFMEMKYSPTRIVFGKVEDPRTISAQAAQQAQVAAAGGDTSDVGLQEESGFNTVLAHGALMPMDQMFAVQRNSATAQNVIAGLWPKQCAGFIHLCLYGRNGRFQKAFFDFVDRSSREGVTEDLFKECFHLSYSQMLSELRGYAEFTSNKFSEFRAKKGEQMPEPPELALREATQAEVGRIKGDALRLAGHADAAHLTMIAPYVRGERDPELLASIGMEEFADGRQDRARKFLEAAASAHAGRARAYLDLATLRMNSVRGDRLNVYALNDVLTPLFQARHLGPALPEVYETIAFAWERSELDPTAKNLAVVDEGARLFPEDGVLTSADRRLHDRIGDKPSSH